MQQENTDVIPVRTHTAGGVVLNTQGQVLVVSQKGNSWSLPKGHVEEGEDLLSAAKREIYEESGITQLEFVKQLPVYERFKIGLEKAEDKSELKVIHLMLFRTAQLHLHPVDPENPEARWVDIVGVSELLTHPKDKAFFTQIIPELK